MTKARTIGIPEFSLVVLVGASGSGKSTFARKHFKETEILSSDAFRAMLSDDDNDQSVTNQAFDALHYIAAQRLALKRLTVIDATNVRKEDRQPLLDLARQYHVMAVALVFNLDEEICHERNAQRPNRNFGPHVVRRHTRDMRRSIKFLKKDGFRYMHVFNSPEELDAVTFEREKLWTDKRDETGPFDIIGDIHGCFDELTALLTELGYSIETQPDEMMGTRYAVTPPEGRKVVFLGDFTDRGPNAPDALRLAISMVEDGVAIAVPGNHDVKLVRKLGGRNVQLKHGLEETVEQLEKESPEFRDKVRIFLDGLISHYELDGGKLVVAHAGMKESLQGRASGKVRSFALFGETTGETDEFGLPIRYPWANEYRGEATVVYGHTAIPEPEWLNRTICIDTGCVYGGKLTALRYPEMELVSVPAREVYSEPVRPLTPAGGDSGLSAQHRHDDLLDITDVLGKRIIETRLRGKLTIREENGIAALEVMSRFAVNPRWLIYLPPTMSPSHTSQRPDLLEHPEDAFAYYHGEGVKQVVAEEKHMGSRAVVIICRDAEAALRRFGVTGDHIGTCYTRTGRAFFNDVALERTFLERIRSALTATGFWEEFDTTWACLDAELMPWSAKAQELLQRQYAAVGAAATAASAQSVNALEQAAAAGLDVGDLLARVSERARMANQFVEAYRRYCWPVNSLDDLRLAPFHLLATEGAAHVDRDHEWHMSTLAAICAADESLLLATPYRVIDLDDENSLHASGAWWEELTARGGEGIVVKPRDFVVEGKRGLVQPAVKSRGREYLRIIYGPEYTMPANLERLRRRGLSRKRGLALREFALGVEGLERFVRREPLRRVHECVFGVLALESEPVDPRL